MVDSTELGFKKTIDKDLQPVVYLEMKSKDFSETITIESIQVILCGEKARAKLNRDNCYGGLVIYRPGDAPEHEEENEKIQVDKGGCMEALKKGDCFIMDVKDMDCEAGDTNFIL